MGVVERLGRSLFVCVFVVPKMDEGPDLTLCISYVLPTTPTVKAFAPQQAQAAVAAAAAAGAGGRGRLVGKFFPFSFHVVVVDVRRPFLCIYIVYIYIFVAPINSTYPY